jgi:hypothetical protein
MDDLTKQKIPIIIKEHILHTKIGYVIEALRKEKRKCKPIALDKGAEMNKGSSVYVKHIAYEPIKESTDAEPMLEINRSARGIVDSS